jgi:hypothetical protein
LLCRKVVIAADLVTSTSPVGVPLATGPENGVLGDDACSSEWIVGIPDKGPAVTAAEAFYE